MLENRAYFRSVPKYLDLVVLRFPHHTWHFPYLKWTRRSWRGVDSELNENYFYLNGAESVFIWRHILPSYSCAPKVYF